MPYIVIRTITLLCLLLSLALMIYCPVKWVLHIVAELRSGEALEGQGISEPQKVYMVGTVVAGYFAVGLIFMRNSFTVEQQSSNFYVLAVVILSVALTYVLKKVVMYGS